MPGTRFDIKPLHVLPPTQLMLDLDNSKFCSYHEANPHIYRKFEELTLETIKKGFKNYSSAGIFELIRWHSATSAIGDCFKLNNGYKPFYARLFEKKHPEHKGFFRTRKSKFDGNDNN